VAGEDRAVTLLLEPELDHLPAGPTRARAYLLLAEAGIVDHIDDARTYLDRALEEAGDDPRTRTSALSYGAVHAAVASVATLEAADAMAEQAAREERVEPAVRRYALFSLAWTRAMRGRDIDDVCERHAAVAVPAEQIYHAVVRVSALHHMWRGDVRWAETRMRELLATAEERGEGWSTAAMRLHLCELWLRTGEWDLAGRMLRDWDQPSGRGAHCGPAARPAARRCWRRAAATRRRPSATRRSRSRARRRAGCAGMSWRRAARRGSRRCCAATRRRPWSGSAGCGTTSPARALLDPGVFPVAADLVEAGGDAAAVVAYLRAAGDHPYARATLLRVERAPGSGRRRIARSGWSSTPPARCSRTTAAPRRRPAFDALGSPGWAALARAEPRSRPPAPRRDR
jgi:hypothetical protein